MQGKRFKTQDEPRAVRPGRAAGGAHFADSSQKKAKQKDDLPILASSYPQRSIRLQQVVEQSNKEIVAEDAPQGRAAGKQGSAAPAPAAPQHPAQAKASSAPGQAAAPKVHRVTGAASGQTSQPSSQKAAQAQPEPSGAQGRPQRKISALDSAALPRVGPKAGDSAAFRKAVITGVSGSMTKIPSNAPARKVSGTNKGYSRYSNGYFDRPDAKQLTDYVSQFQTEPTEGAPAYSWFPFAIYGGAACLGSVGWAVACVMGGATPVSGTDPMMFAGLVILGCIIVCGLVCVTGVSLATLRKAAFDKVDVWSSAVGKTALVLLANLIVWIVCAAIVG